MNSLKTKTAWSNLELGILKLCLISGGIALGSYFHEYLLPFVLYFLGLSIALALVILPVWIRKERW